MAECVICKKQPGMDIEGVPHCFEHAARVLAAELEHLRSQQPPQAAPTPTPPPPPVDDDDEPVPPIKPNKKPKK